MANYKGYFRTDDSANTLYCVLLIGNSADTSISGYTEIKLAGDSPFVVNYDTSDTPFAPVRTSTATIKIVHNNYMEDILSPYAQGTQVKLAKMTNENTVSKYEWVGFLTPKLYDQSYSYIYEEIELEAADCISSLQYIKYTEDTGYTKEIVSIWSILNKICDNCKLLTRYYWPRTKYANNKILLPTALKISEQNFFSNDTDEPWKLDEVLEEICRYIGMTCLQWEECIYFIDYQNYHSNSNIYLTPYLKASSYAQGAAVYVGGNFTVSQANIRGNGASITFEPVYNKCVVKDNFYTAEYFIPNIFDDMYLRNRQDGNAWDFTKNPSGNTFYISYPISAETPYKALYATKLRATNSKFAEEEVSDNDYIYHHRTYNHRYWDSVYHNATGNTIDVPQNIQKTSAITRNYMGGTIVDLGVVKKAYSSEYGQWIVPNKMDYTRYLCLSCKYNEYNSNYWQQPSPQIYWGPFEMFKLNSSFKPLCLTSSKSFLVINYSILWERYADRAYINPSWTSAQCGVGALASGGVHRTIGNLNFKLRIGNKWWNGKEWKTSPVSTSAQTFSVKCEKTDEQADIWNTELSVLNNIAWDNYINEEGYKIPLEGIDITKPIEFEIHRPSPQFMYNSGSNRFTKYYHFNAYCWVKDLSIKCVEEGQDIERTESDVVYENVIDTDAVNTISDITCKLTTHTTMTKPSYSNVIYFDETTSAHTLLESIREMYLSNVYQKPEENIVEKYVNQYNTSTKKIAAVLDRGITPFNKIYGIDVDSPNTGYIQLGTQINYAEAKQEITLIQVK